MQVTALYTTLLQLMYQSHTLAMALHTKSQTTFIDRYSPEYVSKVRANLATFHRNLDTGNFGTVAALLAPDYFWNYEGNIILTAQAGAATLEGFVTSALNCLHEQDIYNIVDGNQGAVLFRISGRQSGNFVGLPVQEDGRFNALSAEMFTFNANALAREVITVTPLDIMKEQMRGVRSATPVPNETLKRPAQKDEAYKTLIKQRMASIHLLANEGNLDAIAGLATPTVELDENGSLSSGTSAFVDLVTAKNAGQGAIPNKLFHDFEILADGSFGAVNFVWQGPQERKYLEFEPRAGALVRLRSTLFFEFDDQGLVTRATSVYDEGVVNATLTGTGGWGFPV